MRMASTILPFLTIVFCWGCMLDIIWNAVEDEYLTVIMYLLCSLPMRFSGKTSQMIHNKRNDVGGRAPCLAGPLEGRDSPQSQSRSVESAVAGRSTLRRGRDRHPRSRCPDPTSAPSAVCHLQTDGVSLGHREVFSRPGAPLPAPCPQRSS